MSDDGELIPGSDFHVSEDVSPEDVNRAVRQICAHVVDQELGRVRRVLSGRLVMVSVMCLGAAVGGFLFEQPFLLFALPIPIALLLIFLPLYSALSTREVTIQLVLTSPPVSKSKH